MSKKRGKDRCPFNATLMAQGQQHPRAQGWPISEPPLLHLIPFCGWGRCSCQGIVPQGRWQCHILGRTGFLALPHIPGTSPAELAGAEQCKGEFCNAPAPPRIWVQLLLKAVGNRLCSAHSCPTFFLWEQREIWALHHQKKPNFLLNIFHICHSWYNKSGKLPSNRAGDYWGRIANQQHVKPAHVRADLAQPADLIPEPLALAGIPRTGSQGSCPSAAQTICH